MGAFMRAANDIEVLESRSLLSASAPTRPAGGGRLAQISGVGPEPDPPARRPDRAHPLGRQARREHDQPDDEEPGEGDRQRQQGNMAGINPATISLSASAGRRSGGHHHGNTTSGPRTPGSAGNQGPHHVAESIQRKIKAK